MITHLIIKNYTLIDTLEIDFQRGFSVITGETGAGKSIILGALSLLLGNRADSKTIQPGKKKCVIEAHFDIRGCRMQAFFEENGIDLDEDDCILRRELSDSGKSRAFINDTPVSLSVLKSLSEHLVDIHSQHQNLLLMDADFQLSTTDIMAGNQQLLDDYHSAFGIYLSAVNRLKEMKKSFQENVEREDYIRFVVSELKDAELNDVEEQEQLESLAESMEHVEEIKSTLYEVDSIFHAESRGVLANVKNAVHELAGIEKVFPDVSALSERLDSALVEMKDIAGEIQDCMERVDFDPREQERVIERLDLLNSLERKHHCSSVKELIALRDQYVSELHNIDNFDADIEQQERVVAAALEKVKGIAQKLSQRRKRAAKEIDGVMQESLKCLGMERVRFVTEVVDCEVSKNGTDKVTFLFSANSSIPVQPVAQIASGGEVARVMLSLKALISNAVSLPTIIFDEVDTGVSGKVAEAMAKIMHDMGKTGRQVISITHLPQIAAMGSTHYYVRKRETEEGTRTGMHILSEEERVEVIAQMVSGSDISEAARQQARELLSKNS